MKLDAYLLQHQLSPAEFAREIDVGRMAVHRYLRGERFPRPDVLQRIFSATAGQVTANDFVETVTSRQNDNRHVEHLSTSTDIGQLRYPWSRTTARERRSSEKAFAQMMQEPPEGEAWSPAISTAIKTLTGRARFQNNQFQLDGRTVRAAAIVVEANRLRKGQGLPLLRYPGVVE